MLEQQVLEQPDEVLAQVLAQQVLEQPDEVLEQVLEQCFRFYSAIYIYIIKNITHIYI